MTTETSKLTDTTIKANGAAAPKNVRTVHPESVALITNATSLEGLFLASAQAVAINNPKDGALLALVGMAYQDIKNLMSAAQAADMMRAEAASARDRAEAEACAAREAREAARERRSQEIHEVELRRVQLLTEQEEARLERLKKTGSEF